ncbi:hypothetical protein ABDK56_10270 [Sphingomonas sp. ASV193]|uniref:hypothetical protein n=1 Tax=Sphingomonas sp. ASV193 TaxID=3144405 RepID=UPI0032E882DE
MTDRLGDLFANGHAVDIVLAVMLAEALWLVGRARWRALDVALLLGPAVLILLALRAALTGAGWPAIAGLLAASLPLHLADLARRRRER